MLATLLCLICLQFSWQVLIACVSVLRVAVPARALNGPLLDSRLGRKYGILLLLSILGAASVTAM